MSPVAVSADRRFHRAHVKPARRRGAWRTASIGVLKYGLILGLVAYAAERAVTFVSTSPLLEIERISPSGNQRITSDAVRSTLAGLRGENILFADLDGWRSKLLDMPWVRDATFRRSLPSTVEVVIQERLPVAVGRMGGRLYLVDERGAVIDEYGPRYSNLDLPIVDGFDAGTGDPRAADVRGAIAARLIMALRQKPAVASRLSQVDVSDVHNVTILLNDDPAELRLGEDRFLARVESYLSLSDALHQRVPLIDYVDLRFDGRVYVRPVAAPVKAAAAAPARAKTGRVSDAKQH